MDIWALGVILYKLAFFQTPFEDSRGNVEAEAILQGLGERKVGGSVVSMLFFCAVVRSWFICAGGVRPDFCGVYWVHGFASVWCVCVV